VSARVAGKVVAVTGGASGIGHATAELLRTEGATVVVGDLAVDDGAGHVLDVTVEDQVAAFFSKIVEEHRRLDGLVHCAGTGGAPTRITATDLATWRHVLDVNLTGAMLAIKHAATHIAAGGSIVAIASLNATQAAAGAGAYAASKAGLAMLVKVAALELGAAGVRVNALAPGLVATPLTAPLVEAHELLEEYVENTPLGRHGQPGDVARAALFLVSDEATWMTGDLIAIDGGAQLMRYPNLLAKLSPDTTVGR
jgi:3-oxoacyl-[acyl-carrier protein] reductase